MAKVYQPDGSFDFSRGVNSAAVTTVRSNLSPNGLRRDQLAWLVNATCRGGGITQRTGWQPNVLGVSDGKSLYQGGLQQMYQPLDGSNPYFLFLIGGHVIKAIPDGGPITDLSKQFNLFLPPTVDQAFWIQAEEFAIVQAGDGVTLPLFWDNSTLRSSNGFSKQLGVTAADFIVPGVGLNVDVTLTSPYLGTLNQIVTINGFQYLEVDFRQFYTLTNVEASPVGGIVPSNSLVSTVTGGIVTPFGHTLSQFTIPAVGATVVTHIDTIQAAFPPGTTFLINGANWTITVVGTVPPAVNHVYLLNINDVPGNTEVHPIALISVFQLPAATAMTYYMNRVWYAQGRTYAAGDIVKGASGTAKYQKRDSILNVTENPLAFGGDGFTIPASDGNIRALRGIPQLQQNLGQGQLHIFTRKKVYSQYVPVTRADWIAAGNAAAGPTSAMPLQTVVLDSNGSVNDRSLVAVNGDFYYQSLTPAVRSLILGERDYNEPGNVPISRNENRILRFNNRALMRFSSGMEFDNRLWQLVSPQATKSSTPGAVTQVTHQAAIPLDFDIISNLDEKLPPAWEGHYEGEDMLQLFTGDFGGLERAFASVVSRIDGTIQVWELTTNNRRENGDNRITWQMEFPAFTWGKDFELKEIHGAEIWIDKEFGEVSMTLEYRPDADPCYKLWGAAEFCVARVCEEDLQNPVCYPVGPLYREGYCFPVTFPKPTEKCAKSNCQRRPSDVGFQFQTRLTIKGWCRVRGIILWATFVERGIYDDMNACLPPGDVLKPVLVDP